MIQTDRSATGTLATETLAIETRALRRVYDAEGGPVVALDGVDLDVRAGELFGLLGPNGAGKTW